MTQETWRAAACGLGVALAAAVLPSAQTPTPAPSAVFRLYLLGRDVGRETDVLSTSERGRSLASTVTFADRGTSVSLSTNVEADFDWAPRRLTARGQPFAGATTDLDITVSDTAAVVRDRAATRTIAVAGAFFPVAGPLPAALQEYLIGFWRSHGRPKEIPSAPGGPLRIELRAEEQIEAGGRVIRLERLAIEGPAWGRQTAWAEFSGNLDAIVTWVDGLPFLAVRDGFEGRADRFIAQALRDRIDDFERVTSLALAEHTGGVVLTGAAVIATGLRPPVPNSTIVVRDGRIVEIGPPSRVKAPEDLPTLDARGMTVVAGLWDMGAPMSQLDFAPAYLAAGITSVRAISPDPAFGTALRDALAESPGRLVAPRLFQAGFIDGENGVGPVRAATLDEGRQAVRRYRGSGLRFLEVSASVTAPVLGGIVAEAHRLGMRVAARAPAGMTAQQVIEARLDQLVGMVDASDGFAALAKAQVTLEPEASWNEFLLRAPGDVLPALVQPGDVSLPRSLAASLGSLDGRGSSAGRAALVAAVRAAREAKVSLVPGSGPGLPGISLVRDLELFVEAGMTPAEALQAATSVPARLMRADDSGTVEAGKRADFVVLAGNPLEDISNLRKARWVVANGMLYDCAKLWQAAGFGN